MLTTHNTTEKNDSKLGSLVKKAKAFAEEAHRINSTTPNKRSKLIQTRSLEEDMAELQRKRELAAFEADLDKMLVKQEELSAELLQAQRSVEPLKPVTPKIAAKIEPVVKITTDRKVVFADQIEHSYIIENNRSLSVRKHGADFRPIPQQQPLKHYAFDDMRQAKVPPNLEFKINLIAFVLAVFTTGLGFLLLSLYIDNNMQNPLPNKSAGGIKFSPG